MTTPTTNPASTKRAPTLSDALIPVVALIVLLAGSVYLYGSDSSGGPNQIALILSASVAVLVGLKNGYNWKEIESGIVHGISRRRWALTTYVESISMSAPCFGSTPETPGRNSTR